jgi:NAD(P)H-dependent flavin oxidoreductase YrpB (nitropropane dioxygenase family)
MLRTRLCKLLSIEIPVIGAPMGPEIASLELAAAISNAGGLGMISFGGYAPVALKERIRKLRTLTSKPFGVNVLLGGPHLPMPEAAFVDACLDERVPVLSFFWGDCTPYVERAHKLGIRVCDQVGSVSAAKRAERAGVDFIIAQGVEAGGHVAGTVGSMVLVPRIADSVAPVPVVAAGGIADGRGLAAALALGAQGVVLGTRLLAATECNTHEVYRRRFWPQARKTQFVRHCLAMNGRMHLIERCELPSLNDGCHGRNAAPSSGQMNRSSAKSVSGEIGCRCGDSEEFHRPAMLLVTSSPWTSSLDRLWAWCRKSNQPLKSSVKSPHKRNISSR